MTFWSDRMNFIISHWTSSAWFIEKVLVGYRLGIYVDDSCSLLSILTLSSLWFSPWSGCWHWFSCKWRLSTNWVGTRIQIIHIRWVLWCCSCEDGWVLWSGSRKFGWIIRRSSWETSSIILLMLYWLRNIQELTGSKLLLWSRWKSCRIIRRLCYS